MTSSKKLFYAKRLGAVAMLVAFYACVVWLLWGQIREVIAYDLPLSTLHFEKVRPPSSTELLDRDGETIDYWFSTQHRLYVPLNEIDSRVSDFVILLEDAKFQTHGGFDVAEIKNSLEKNLQKGQIKRGGSTITQQLAKNLFLDKERSITRKLFEIPWALRIEKDFSKKQILELYLNTIEWGPGIYGVEAASRHFFDRSARQLELGQAMYLALIVPNPNRFDLFAHPAATDFIKKKQADLVKRLVDEKKIDLALRDTYLQADFGLVPPDSADREFPSLHLGTYAGHRDRKASWLKLLEKGLRPLVSSKQIKLTLNKTLQEEFAALPESETTVDSLPARYAVVRIDNEIVAFRALAKGHSLNEENLQAWLLTEVGEIDYPRNMPWSQLLPLKKARAAQGR